jgi:hypothetical protein
VAAKSDFAVVSMKIRIISLLFVLYIVSVLYFALRGQAVHEVSIPLSYDCSVFPNQSNSEYILPYELGSSFTAIPHAAKYIPNKPAQRAQYYAVDILMPVGTPVVASRSGVVVRVEQKFSDDQNRPGQENFMFVKHEDGTLSRYFHLTKNGALVRVGDSVSQFQKIALSGNSGNSLRPHLHFDVVEKYCDPHYDVLWGLRNCRTFPVVFRNTRDNACGLKYEEDYLALEVNG